MSYNIEEYQNLIKEGLTSRGCQHLRGGFVSDNDFDFYCPKESVDNIKNFLLKESFCVLKSSSSRLFLFKYQFDRILIVDLIVCFNLILEKIPGIYFKNESIKSFISAPDKYHVPINSLRYLIQKKSGDKYISFIRDHKKALIDTRIFSDILINNPFVENVCHINKSLDKIIRKGRISIFPLLKFTYKISYIINRLRFFSKKIAGGKIISIVGPDGSGKTTISKLISSITTSRTVYMGSNAFIMQKLIDSLGRTDFILIKLIRFFIIYFENWIKWIYCFLNKLMGRLVITDRYPSYQYFSIKKPNYHLFHIFYGILFPKPDITFVLDSDPNIILKRKQEHSKETIEKIYSDLKKNLPESKKVRWIRNNDINNTLGTIIKTLNSEKKKFFAYPYTRQPCIYYSQRSILDSKLFCVLHNKLFSKNTLIYLRRNNILFIKIFELLFNRNFEIPNQNIKIIYKGYKDFLYFEFNNNVPIKVWTKTPEGEFKSTDFIGYPVYYNPSSCKIDNSDILHIFLKDYWEKLKEGGTLHGDLTHFNLLVSKENKICLIDRKDNVENSLISDHFYFYAYLLFYIKKQNSGDTTSFISVKEQLDKMFQQIFKEENKGYLKQLISSIDFSKIGNPKVKPFLDSFKKAVLDDAE